ncbi:hypothetical protein GCM10025871_06020 [Deinococcus metallilatus]|nr:hypothetical protein GCM10025871_06020 [Deinococcus metallilatus]
MADGALADPDHGGQVADAQFLGVQGAQQPQAGGVRDHLEERAGFLHTRRVRQSGPDTGDRLRVDARYLTRLVLRSGSHILTIA